jgi:hypothetical protein
MFSLFNQYSISLLPSFPASIVLLLRLVTSACWVACCACTVGLPPLQHDVTTHSDCFGLIDNWRWDRCVLSGSVVWTALYFGHRQKSESKLGNVTCTFNLLTDADITNCRNPSELRDLVSRSNSKKAQLEARTSNSFITSRCSSSACQPQYPPFTARHPLLLSTSVIPPFHDGTLSLLPAVVLGLYIQSSSDEFSKWSWWSSTLNFSMIVHSCDGRSPPLHHWNIFSSSFADNFRCCSFCSSNLFPSNSIRILADTEYLLDNIFPHFFSQQQFSDLQSVPCNPFRVSLHAKLHPDSTFDNQRASGRFSRDVAAADTVLFEHTFFAANQRVPLPATRQAIRRRTAESVTHKLCNAAAVYPAPSPGFTQVYDARTHTVFSSYSDGNNKTIGLSVLGASMRRLKPKRALFEAIVWVEYDNQCGTDSVYLLHCVGQQLETALLCEVAGQSVPAQISQPIASYSAPHKHREAVVSCKFSDEILQQSSHVLSVTIFDTAKQLIFDLPMCAQEKDAAIQKIVACSQPLYNVNYLEKLWPGIIQAWVLYHVR